MGGENLLGDKARVASVFPPRLPTVSQHRAAARSAEGQSPARRPRRALGPGKGLAPSPIFCCLSLQQVRGRRKDVPWTVRPQDRGALGPLLPGDPSRTHVVLETAEQQLESPRSPRPHGSCAPA